MLVASSEELLKQDKGDLWDSGTALEAAKRIDPGPYANWTEPERIVFNVDRAYREFRGEPFDAPVDAMAMFAGMFELRQGRAGA